MKGQDGPPGEQVNGYFFSFSLPLKIHSSFEKKLHFKLNK